MDARWFMTINVTLKAKKKRKVTKKVIMDYVFIK